MNPYVVLEVPPDAGDEAIRASYLAAVKAAPPDADPARFQAVSAAYAKIKNEPARLGYILFDTDCPEASPLEVFFQHAQRRRPAHPPSLEALKEYLRACAKT